MSEETFTFSCLKDTITLDETLSCTLSLSCDYTETDISVLVDYGDYSSETITFNTGELRSTVSSLLKNGMQLLFSFF